MKIVNQFISLFLVALLLCGCGKSEKKPKEKPLPKYETDFVFDNKNTLVNCQNENDFVIISNEFENRASLLYSLLNSDSFVPIKSIEKSEKNKEIILIFENTSILENKATSIQFNLYSNNKIAFVEDNKTYYFKTKEDTFKQVSEKTAAFINEKNSYYKTQINDNKTNYSLLKADGKSTDLSIDSNNTIAYICAANLLRIVDKSNNICYYFEHEKGVVSKAVSTVSDYKNGYICNAQNNTVKISNIFDSGFNYSFDAFEKPLNNQDNPFVSIEFVDDNTAEVTYISSENCQTYTQKIDIKKFVDDYEAKKKAKQEALEKQSQSTVKQSNTSNDNKYDTPSTVAVGNIPPFTAEMDAELMKYTNIRSGYGWKGSENRQDYYSKFNAYATGDRSKNIVYLTFDEGYEYNENTNKILDTLKAKNVKATFFVTMDFAKKRPDLVNRMISEGHVVGNHSTTHPSFPSISTKEAYNEIKTLHEYVLNNFGYNMYLFRFPEGAASERMLALVKSMNYRAVFWNCAYADWDTSNQPSADTTRKLISENTQNGTIYLFHAVSNTNVSMLAEIIDTVRTRGYQFGLIN